MDDGSGMECVGPAADSVTVMVSERDDDMIGNDRDFYMKHTYNCTSSTSDPSMQQLYAVHEQLGYLPDSAENANELSERSDSESSRQSANTPRLDVTMVVGLMMGVCSTMLLVVAALVSRSGRRQRGMLADRTPQADGAAQGAMAKEADRAAQAAMSKDADGAALGAALSVTDASSGGAAVAL
jgi:hypothetical protein